GERRPDGEQPTPSEPRKEALEGVPTQQHRPPVDGAAPTGKKRRKKRRRKPRTDGGGPTCIAPPTAPSGD
ncbi:MAG: hypothetical protein WBA12_13835, partial [Catalinimonas sp.]